MISSVQEDEIEPNNWKRVKGKRKLKMEFNADLKLLAINRVSCPTHKGTLKRFVWSRMN